MPQTTAERLDRLEQENADLKAEVDRLKGKVEPPPPPAPVLPYGGQPYVEPRGASVTVQGDPLPPDLTEADICELRRIVGVAHPHLTVLPRGVSEHQALRQFANALRAVGMLFGCNELDEKHALSWWVDHVQSVADRGAGHNDFTGSDFTAAALALGVWHRAWSPSSPIEFGLVRWVSYGSGKVTWPLKDKWRETLKRGQILPPHVPARVPLDSRTGRVAAGPDR